VRPFAGFGVLGLALASIASAQSPFTHRDGSDEGDAILPITSYPLGQSQVVAASMARNLRMRWLEREACDQIGCLVVQNDTRFYKVAQFRIELMNRDGSSRWSRNQLLHPLLPKEKLVRLKVAPADSCERDIMFVLQHRKTREQLVMESTTNLCPTPNADNVIRIDVKKPEVIVQEPPLQ
jgi:hypothetical protein